MASKGIAALRTGRAVPDAPVAAPAIAAPSGIVEVPWRDLELSPLNPRKRFDGAEIDALADSIFAKGVMQNLIARPRTDQANDAKPAPFEVAAGSRRWRAIAKLIADGKVTDVYPVPVRIVPMTDREFLAFAMTENLQRQDMTALEEADGFAQMIELGDTVETIVASTGYPAQRVRQRLALHHRLAPPVKRALDDGTINLGQAQAFTLGDHERQADLLGVVAQSARLYTPGEIRRVLVEKFIPMSRGIFPVDRYKGPLRRDLFGPEEGGEERYAEDRTEFERLQTEAVQAKRAELAETWAWAEVRRGGFVYLSEFDRDESPARAGAIVHLRDDLRVEIHTGLVRRQPVTVQRSAGRPAPSSAAGGEGAKSETGAAAAAAVTEPARPFSRAHLVWASQEKTRRLQLAAAAEASVHAAVATSLLILALLGSQEVKIRKGSGWSDPPEDRPEAIANKQLRADIDAKLQRLNGDTTPSEAVLFRRLIVMPGEDRRALFGALVAECFGTWAGHEPELGDSALAIAVAEALDIVTPDKSGGFEMSTSYLERLSKAELERVAGECGVELPDGAKKGEMIDTIALSDKRDPAWNPTELRFATRPELMRRLGFEQGGGGGVTRKAERGVIRKGAAA